MNLAMFWGHNGGTWPYDGITFVPGHMVTFARQNHFQCTIGGHGASPWKSWASEWTHREILNNNDLTCSSCWFFILTCSNEDEIHFFFGKRFSLGSLFVGHFSEKYLENIKHVWWMNEEQSCKLRSKETLFPQLLQFTNCTSLEWHLYNVTGCSFSICHNQCTCASVPNSSFTSHFKFSNGHNFLSQTVTY